MASISQQSQSPRKFNTVAIGMTPRNGPWGGGNAFVKALTDKLTAENIDVVYDLKRSDIDIVLLMDPRPQSSSASFDHNDIQAYLQYVNEDSLVIHRVNECDERKNTIGINQILRDANQYADHTVFVSAWLRDLHLKQGMPAQPNTVINNGSDRNIFHNDGYQQWDGNEPLKLVTHHWSGNWNKGFDIYQQLDQLLAEEPYRSKFAFTYIGNVPDDFTFHNSTYIEPLSGKPLADALRQNHVYISASENDPGPNHQNEGANCGLPFLYRPSGGLTEYCEGFGIAFTAETLEEKLLEMLEAYQQWRKKIVNYPYNAEAMASQYLELFQTLIEQRDSYLQKRTWLKDSLWQSFMRKVNQWRL